MITVTWWGALTIATIIACTAAFIAYWSGYRAGRADGLAVNRDEVDDLWHENDDLWDELERMRDDAHRRHGGYRLNPDDIVGFRRIVKGDQ
jgi:hypothetical protein